MRRSDIGRGVVRMGGGGDIIYGLLQSVVPGKKTNGFHGVEAVLWDSHSRKYFTHRNV